MKARILSTIKILCLIIILILAIERILSSIFPPDLQRLNDYSQVIYGDNAEILRIRLNSQDQWHLALKDFPKHYVNLLINYEDQRFYKHSGVDFLALARATMQNISQQRRVSGASTISMQTAKMLYSSGKRTIRKKIIEIFRARQLERHFSKEEIIRMYADLVPVGGNKIGIETAARYYFNKPASQLSIAETAWLIALPQSPNSRQNLKIAQPAIQRILEKSYKNQSISKDQYQLAVNNMAIPKAYEFANYAPHLTDRYKNKNKFDINVNLQKKFEAELKENTKYLPKEVSFAAILVDNQSGKTLVYVGNSANLNDEKRKGSVDILQALRSPGSTLKPFIYLAAMDRYQYQANSLIDDTPLANNSWQPDNYDYKFSGRISFADALRKSRNTPAVRLINQYGSDNFASWLEKRGLKLSFPKKYDPNSTLILGGVGIRAHDLIHLYRQLALCTYEQKKEIQENYLNFSQFPNSPILSNYKNEYNVINNTNYLRFANPENCIKITKILQDTTYLRYGKEKMSAKSGTSYGWRDLWLVAYSKQYSILLWRGRADGGFSTEEAGLNALLPIMQRLVALLPNPPQKETYLIENKNNIHTIHTKIAAQLNNKPEKISILFPQNNSEIELNKNNPSITLHCVNYERAPLNWWINNEYLGTSDDGKFTFKPQSNGFFKLRVIDDQGNFASSVFSIINQ